MKDRSGLFHVLARHETAYSGDTSPVELLDILDTILSPEGPTDVNQHVMLCRNAIDRINPYHYPLLEGSIHSELAYIFLAVLPGPRSENAVKAIYHSKKALECYKTGNLFVELPEIKYLWGLAHHNLAKAYLTCTFGNRFNNIERAIRHLNDSLTVYVKEVFPERWACVQNDLGLAYRIRNSGDRIDNLQCALSFAENAYTFGGSDFSEKDQSSAEYTLAMAHASLADEYIKKHGMGSDQASSIEQAREHFEKTVGILNARRLIQDDLEWLWKDSKLNLSSVYWRRIMGDKAENIELCIQHCEEMLTVVKAESSPELWAAVHTNLGIAYKDRVRGRRKDNLERAIHHCKEAIKLQPPMVSPEKWAEKHINLGACYLERIGGVRADNIELAIEHFKQALAIRTSDRLPDAWAQTLNNLGNAYVLRVEGEKKDNVIQAINLYNQALEVRTRERLPELWAETQANLGSAYSVRFWCNQAENRKQSIEHYEAALEVYTREAFPANHREIQGTLGGLHFGQGGWARADAAYTAAIEAGGDLLAAAYTEIGRRAEVGKSARLYAEDAYTLLRLQRPGDALVRLEQGKTRLLSEALALTALDLTMLAEADQEAIRSARQAVRELEAEMRLPPDTPARRSDRELAEALRQARANLNRLIERIRAEQPEFMPTGLDLPELLRLIPEGGALVAPLFTAKGSAVFVLPHGTATVTKEHVIELDRFTTANLRALLQGADDKPELGGWLGAYAKSRADRQGWFAAIETTGRDLWVGLIGAVHERLAGLGLAQGASVLLMPQGGLGLLPLHAAWRTVNGQKRCLLDDWSGIYAPSGYAVSVSRERLKDKARQGQALLAVVNPTRDLAFTPAEAKAVMALFADARPLEEAEATVNAVIDAAPGRQYLHFSSHGFYDWQDAMQSGLVMAEGKQKPLTLATIISDLDLKACRLVTLSACESGITDIRQSPDEFLGLPAGLLQAGAPAVVSTLWPVDDLSTMLLMERFYQNLLAHDGTAPQSPMGALREAQLWLRDATAGDMMRQVYQTTSDRELAATAFRSMRYYGRYPKVKPFTSPYYWAPFAFSGA